MKRYAIIGNKLVDQKNAFLNINDLGLIRGYGVFDFTVCRGEKIHKLVPHVKRFFKSAKIMKLKSPYAINKICDLAEMVVRKNNLKYSSLRLILTGGISPDGKSVKQETFIIINEPLRPFSPEHYEKGVRAITADHKREFPEAKTTNYQFAYMNYPQMKKVGAFELIYTPSKLVLEGLTSNIFIVKGGSVITPKNDILMGITRAEVIEICTKNDIECQEKSMSREELFSADEVFITASSKRIMPVVFVDNTKIGNGRPGKTTKNIMNIYDANFD